MFLSASTFLRCTYSTTTAQEHATIKTSNLSSKMPLRVLYCVCLLCFFNRATRHQNTTGTLSSTTINPVAATLPSEWTLLAGKKANHKVPSLRHHQRKPWLSMRLLLLSPAKRLTTTKKIPPIKVRDLDVKQYREDLIYVTMTRC